MISCEIFSHVKFHIRSHNFTCYHMISHEITCVNSCGFFVRATTKRRSTSTTTQVSDTKLSKYVWSLKQSRRNYSIKWSILKRAAAYTPGGKRCGLCLEEKLCILKAKGNNSLNTRSEFYAKCCHKEKFSACKFKPMTIDKPPCQQATVD